MKDEKSCIRCGCDLNKNQQKYCSRCSVLADHERVHKYYKKAKNMIPIKDLNGYRQWARLWNTEIKGKR